MPGSRRAGRLPGLQRGGVAQWAPSPDRRADVEHGALADDRVAADRDGPGLDAPRPVPGSREDASLRTTVPAPIVTRSVQTGTVARQDRRRRGRCGRRAPAGTGCRAASRRTAASGFARRISLDEPEPQVRTPHSGISPRLPPADQQPLRGDRQQRTARGTAADRTPPAQPDVDHPGARRRPPQADEQDAPRQQARARKSTAAAAPHSDVAQWRPERVGTGVRRRGRRGAPCRAVRRGERRERASRWVQVDVLHRDRRQRGPLPHLGGEPRQEQRVRAEVVEEVGGRPRPGPGRGRRRAPAASTASVGRRPARRTPRSRSAASGCGGGSAFRSALPLVVIGTTGEVLEVGGHHVGRAAARGGARADRRRRGRRRRCAGCSSRRARRCRVRLVGVDHGLRDRRALQQHRLDLGQLDAVAADLDLEVDPAEVLDLAVGRRPGRGRRCGRSGPTGCRARRGSPGRTPRGQVVAVDVAPSPARPRRCRSRRSPRAAGHGPGRRGRG